MLVKNQNVVSSFTIFSIDCVAFTPFQLLAHNHAVIQEIAGIFVTIDTSLPEIRLTNNDLPVFGFPITEIIKPFLIESAKDDAFIVFSTDCIIF